MLLSNVYMAWHNIYQHDIGHISQPKHQHWEDVCCASTEKTCAAPALRRRVLCQHWGEDVCGASTEKTCAAPALRRRRVLLQHWEEHVCYASTEEKTCAAPALRRRRVLRQLTLISGAAGETQRASGDDFKTGPFVTGWKMIRFRWDSISNLPQDLFKWSGSGETQLHIYHSICSNNPDSVWHNF